MQRRLFITGGVVLLAVVVLIALLAWPRGSDPVSEEDAVESFRETDRAGSTPEDTEESASAVPEPGVYRYVGSGTETVQLGPIPPETRELPGEVNAVVTEVEPLSDETCFITTINLIEQHTEGSITGTWDEKLTFTTDDALLVGIERLFDLDGFASFLEDFQYELTSATPSR